MLWGLLPTLDSMTYPFSPVHIVGHYTIVGQGHAAIAVLHHAAVLGLFDVL